MLKKVSKIIIMSPIIFMFLPALYIPLGLNVPIYLLSLIILFLILICISYKSVVKTFLEFYKYTPYKNFVLYIMWAIFASAILIIIGKVTFIHYISSIIIIVFGYYFLYSLYPAFVSYKYISIKDLYKIFSIAYLLIFIWGIITYYGNLYGNSLIIKLTNFLSNKQTLMLLNNYVIARSRSVFFEPGIFANFIDLNLPILYTIFITKRKIFNNKYFNIIIKKSIFPLALINLFLTQSPLGIVFAIIIIFLFLIKKMLTSIKNPRFLISTMIISILIFCIIVQKKDVISDSRAYKRFATVIESCTDIDSLSIKDTSFYSRIVSHVNNFCLFLKNPIFGVGIDNAKFVIQEQFKDSPIPLSLENQANLALCQKTQKMHFNRAILFDSLSETGLVGFILLYAYFILTYVNIGKIVKYLCPEKGKLLLAFNSTILITICLSFYEVSLISSPFHFFIFSFANSVILKFRKYGDAI